MEKTLLAGRYELLDDLGSGGMAQVWRGRDRRLDREVAVKVLSAQLAADRGFTTRFEREAMHVASLKHPNIVTVYDSGNEGDTYYIVMELVEGESLQSRLEATSPYMDIDLVVRLGAEVLAGLAHAHARGIIHRDIKPANILIGQDDTAKLADFGIARSASDAAGLTTTGTFIGTVFYAAPEQLSGEPATPATDQYSLGCVLYQCLTGRPPFEADIPAGVMAQHLQMRPSPLRHHRPEIPAALEDVVLRALEKEPDRRFASAAEMAEALTDAVRPESDDDSSSTIVRPSRAVPGEQGGGPTRPPRSWRTAALIGLPVAVAVVYFVVAAVAGLPPFGSTSSTKSATKVTTPPAVVFDRCLVGHWTVQSATIPFTVSLSGQTAQITGGQGAETMYTADGTETDDYSHSAPFLGNVNGANLSVTVRGTLSLRGTASNGTFTVLHASTAGFVGTASVNGGPGTTFQATAAPAGTTYAYTCSASRLSVNRQGETIVWTR